MAKFIIRIEFHNVKEHHYKLYAEFYKLMEKGKFYKHIGEYSLPSGEYYAASSLLSKEKVLERVKNEADKALNAVNKQNSIYYSILIIEAVENGIELYNPRPLT